ncbi:biliverdin-producing heme oxygenase, partial [Nocardia sp. NPDC004722]
MLETSTPFSTLIRTATEQQHNEAEHSTFMSDLFAGRLGVEAFYRYTSQLWFVYVGLDNLSESLCCVTVGGPLLKGELSR